VAQDQLEKLATELVTRPEDNTKVWCGLSSAGASPGDLRRVYGEAVATIEIMQAIGRKKRAMCYTDLGIFGMLSIDKNRFVDFTQKVLGPIIEYDRQHQLRLLETLNLYYNNNCNLQQTARAGYLSLSTLKYRLRRIREISNLNLDDPDTRLQVQLALKLLL
jgi:purine catabolism regulator